MSATELRLVVVFLALAGLATPQTNRGTITGTVQDPANAVVPNAAANQDFVLNPKAWSDVPQGQWGFSAPYYSDYRYARIPGEHLSLGPLFRLRERYRFQIRAEFFNLFNRIVMPQPSAGNPLQTPTRNAAGVPTAGFGRIDSSSVSGQRNGQIVARVEW